MTVRILNGDCLTALSMLPACSVRTCVTSPPYFGLRDYGMDGQIGLEESPDQYVAKLVDVFREVRRVLRDDGTLWLNLGDSYAGSGRGGSTGEASTLEGSSEYQNESKRARNISSAQRDNAVPARGSRLPAGLHEDARQSGAVGRAWVKPPEGLKQKDLIGIPWMVAFALRTDGWYLRQDIIWHKPNPMPHPNEDRCVTAHEYVFLFSKRKKYYFDFEAIREPVAAATVARMTQPNLEHQHGSDRAHAGAKSNGRMKPVLRKQDGTGNPTYTGFNDRYFAKDGPTLRNKRSVWTVTTKPFKEAHFATFPPDLIEPCILAGSPTGGDGIGPLRRRRHDGSCCATPRPPCHADRAQPEVRRHRREALGC